MTARSNSRVGKSEAASPRPSASLILLSPLPPSELTPDGFDYKVCMLKRHARLSAAPSATVFPGGNLEEADRIDAACFAGQEGDTAMTQYRICALRETWEETGILVGYAEPRVNSIKWLEGLRKEVYSQGTTIASVFEGISSRTGHLITPPLDSLVHWSNWITPVGTYPKRFDTHFFLYIMPRIQFPQRTTGSTGAEAVPDPVLIVDGTESVSAEWTTPRQALDDCLLHRKITLLPPQIYHLAELIRLPRLADVKAAVTTRRVQPFLPEVKPVEGRKDMLAFVLPGDEEHSAKPGADGARHRSYAITRVTDGGTSRPVRPPQVSGFHRHGVPGLIDIQEGYLPLHNARL